LVGGLQPGTAFTGMWAFFWRRLSASPRWPERALGWRANIAKLGIGF